MRVIAKSRRFRGLQKCGNITKTHLAGLVPFLNGSIQWLIPESAEYIDLNLVDLTHEPQPPIPSASSDSFGYFEFIHGLRWYLLVVSG